MRLAIGTGGWRGRPGDEIDAIGLRAFARAVDAWRGAPGGCLLLGHDGRALGAAILDIVEGELRRWGRVRRLEGPVPTPVLTWALARGHGAAGLQVTASHNPPSDQGLKFFARGGVSLSGKDARRLAQDANRHRRVLQHAAQPSERLQVQAAERWGAHRDYARALAGTLRFDGAVPEIVHDALYGSGGPLLARALRNAKARVTSIRAVPDPRFGGESPDPRPGTLRILSRRSRAAGCIGVATDGDADRFALVDETGTACPEDEALALLIEHVVTSRGERGALVLSCGVGSLPERVARFHSIDVHRTPVGFHHCGRQLRSGGAVLAGDESGGFAWSGFSNDKDGLLACGLLAELAAKPGGVRAARRSLRRRFGPSAWARGALTVTPARRTALSTLAHSPRSSIAGAAVRGACFEDGARFTFADGFLMLRPSQTERLIRWYAEAADPAALRARVAAAAALLDAAGRSR